MPATVPSEAPCRGHGPLPRATPVVAGRPRDADPQVAAITSISTINPGNASERTSTMVSAGHGALK